ncbi:MAG: 50S ribosomal protein L9 [Lewinellaceae bacterium]|nr:50S ribosomal protein L9 [Saprospiraceae bacterium]MCB9315472.1 50S ribosomal protein L9 [Lewinellaceae bacterium]MCB9331150.1 50S ribosomal protein L9 [Lewinellaceae bacterium]
MDVILLEYIDKVGDKHEVVKVKNGYGRNYLIPKGLAIVANKSNMARLDGLKKQFAKKESAKIDTYKDYASKLAGKTLKIVAKAGESGRLFGSVHAQHLIDAIQEELGFEVEKRMIRMPDEVKELGSYEAEFKFHEEVVINVNFDVVRDKNDDTDERTDTGSAKRSKAAPAAEEPPVVEATVVDTPAAAADLIIEDVVHLTETAEKAADVEVAAAEETAEEAVEDVVAEATETVEAAEAAAEEVADEEVVEAEVPAEADSEDESDKDA